MVKDRLVAFLILLPPCRGQMLVNEVNKNKNWGRDGKCQHGHLQLCRWLCKGHPHMEGDSRPRHMVNVGTKAARCKPAQAGDPTVPLGGKPGAAKRPVQIHAVPGPTVHRLPFSIE